MINKTYTYKIQDCEKKQLTSPSSQEDITPQNQAEKYIKCIKYIKYCKILTLYLITYSTFLPLKTSFLVDL